MYCSCLERSHSLLPIYDSSEIYCICIYVFMYLVMYVHVCICECMYACLYAVRQQISQTYKHQCKRKSMCLKWKITPNKWKTNQKKHDESGTHVNIWEEKQSNLQKLDNLRFVKSRKIKKNNEKSEEWRLSQLNRKNTIKLEIRSFRIFYLIYILSHVHLRQEGIGNER